MYSMGFKHIIILTATILAGCATATETYTPDGSVGHSISCSGTASNWGYCYQKAGELCGERGYKTYSKEGDSGVVGNQYYVGSAVTRSMLISCNK